MPATEYSFQMVGGVPVVTAPAEIDTTTAGQLRAILVQWQSRGHATIVVDLTGTQFCDSAGLRELAVAHKRGVASGGGLRLVTPAEGAFPRIFTVTGLDGIIPHFATIQQALADIPATASRRLRQGPAHTPEDSGPVADSRRCEQCGAMFVPVREHARFCTSGCRTAWDRERLGDPDMEASALTWSIVAMSEATARLPAVQVWDHERAFAAIAEAVWWTTMVDAALVRYHQGAYNTVMTAHTPASRQLIVEALGGLRFVRNRIGRGAPLSETIETSAGSRRITRWTWKPTGEPALTGLSPRAQAWEITRYRAYQARLARHTIGETFRQTATFLTLTGARAASSTDNALPRSSRG
jgi:anti-sigma B factor antagonist